MAKSAEAAVNKNSLNDRIIKRLDLKAKGNGNKPYYKSVRFGCDVFEALDAVEGKSFNVIFSNICSDYIRTIPERKYQAKELDKQIEDKKNQIKKLQEKLDSINTLVSNMEMLLNNANILQKQLEEVNMLARNLG